MLVAGRIDASADTEPVGDDEGLGGGLGEGFGGREDDRAATKALFDCSSAARIDMTVFIPFSVFMAFFILFRQLFFLFSALRLVPLFSLSSSASPDSSPEFLLSLKSSFLLSFLAWYGATLSIHLVGLLVEL